MQPAFLQVAEPKPRLKNFEIRAEQRASVERHPMLAIHLRIDTNNPTVMSEAFVVERLGNASALSVKISGGDMLMVQTNGNRQVTVRDQVPIHIDLLLGRASLSY